MSAIAILRRAPRGLSAAELITVVGVATVLFAMINATSRFHVRTFNREYATNAVQPRLRLWMGRMVEEIRSMGYDPLETGSFGLITSTATELVFTADVDEDGILDANETVGFRLSGGDLQFRRGANWRNAVPDVINQDGAYPDHVGPIFTYLDGSGLPTIALGNVHAIRIDLSVVTAGGAERDATILSETTTAEIRNDLLRGSG